MIAAIDLGTSARTEEIDSKTKKTRIYFISKSERDLIAKELKTQFKLPMKDGGKDALDQVAHYYYDLLTRQSFFIAKFSENKAVAQRFHRASNGC